MWPLFITATVSAMVMASSWSWVTWMKVRPDLGLDALELDLHLAAQLEVERAERLVEQQHLGVVDQGAGQGDALLLPAGELGGLARRRSDDICTSSSASSVALRSASAALRRLGPKATLSRIVRCGNSA